MSINSSPHSSPQRLSSGVIEEEDLSSSHSSSDKKTPVTIEEEKDEKDLERSSDSDFIDVPQI